MAMKEALDGPIERLDLFVEKVDVRALHRQQLPMVIVYAMPAILPKPVVDWSAKTAHQYRVHPTVVLHALLMYAMGEMTTQDETGLSQLAEFMHTLHASTPVTEDSPGEP
jgi:hypothetical protein